MKTVSIRTLSFVVLCVGLACGRAPAQSTPHQVGPLQNGLGYRHQLAYEQKKDPDPNQSQYTWQELDPNQTGVGYCYADAFAINNSGQVVVNWNEGANCEITHASLWNQGRFSLLDHLPNPNCESPGTYLTSLTASGFAFGTYWNSCPYSPAGGVDVESLRWSFLPDDPILVENQGFGMSENGLAVGVMGDVAGTITKHWMWNGKTYSFPIFPDGWDVSSWWSGPISINNRGEMAGQYVDTATGRLRGYIQQGTKFTGFDAPGSPSATFVTEINNSGEVVLSARYGDDPWAPRTSYLLKLGKFTALPHVPLPGATWSDVMGVNARGDMVGRYLDANFNFHVYVAIRH